MYMRYDHKEGPFNTAFCLEAGNFKNLNLSNASRLTALVDLKDIEV